MCTIAIIEVHRREEDLEPDLSRNSPLAVSVVNTSQRHNHVLMQPTGTIICDIGEGILNGDSSRNSKIAETGGVGIVSIPIDQVFDLGNWFEAIC